MYTSATTVDQKEQGILKKTLSMADDTGKQSIDPLPSKLRSPKQGILQRALVLWLTGIIIAEVVASGITWPVLLQRFQALTATPTPITTSTPITIPTCIATPVTSLPVTSQKEKQAQALVQQYYNDINNTDYQSAYNLWGSSYQSSHSYSSFANGFANTVNAIVTFGDVIPRSDGTIQVEITFQALENSSSGTVTHTFQGSYIVGLENCTWKLLSADVRETS